MKLRITVDHIPYDVLVDVAPKSGVSVLAPPASTGAQGPATAEPAAAPAATAAHAVAREPGTPQPAAAPVAAPAARSPHPVRQMHPPGTQPAPLPALPPLPPRGPAPAAGPRPEPLPDGHELLVHPHMHHVHPANPNEIPCPLGGTVTAVLVSPGSVVRMADPIATVQVSSTLASSTTPLVGTVRALASGTISEITVKVGDEVPTGHVLARLTPA